MERRETSEERMVPVQNALSPETAEIIRTTVQNILAPVMEQIGLILEHNTQAMDRIAATQQLMSQRISELEKQVRLKTPMSRSQERHLGDAIRQRAREILEGKGFGEDKKAVNKLAGTIRKSVLARYGVDSLREAPAYDYEVAMEHAAGWNDLMAIRDVTREARKRAEDLAAAEQDQGMDASKALASPADQPGEPGVRGDMEGQVCRVK